MAEVQRAAAEARPLRMGGVEWALLVLQSMLWGSAFFFAELAVGEIRPLTITSFRLIPAVIVTLAVTKWLGYRLPGTLREWGTFMAISALSNVLPMALILWAQSYTTGGVAAVFNATAPLFAAAFAHVLLGDERIEPRKMAGLALGLSGVAVLVGADVLSGDTGALAAKAALVGAAMCYALASVLWRRVTGYPSYVLACGQMIAALVLSLPLALAIDQPWRLPAPSLTAVLAVGAMGLFGSALAALCYFTVLTRAGATNAMLVTLLLPLTPITLGAVFLGEAILLREIAGALVIAFALLVIDGRVVRWARVALGLR